MATTNNSIHRPELSQHSYITTNTQHPGARKNKRKRGVDAGKQLGGASDEDLVDESDSDVSTSYAEQSDQVAQQQQVFQQIVPQVIIIIKALKLCFLTNIKYHN